MDGFIYFIHSRWALLSSGYEPEVFLGATPWSKIVVSS